MLLLVSSCFVQPDITFDDEFTPELNFGQGSGTQSFAFHATDEWTAESSQTWCKVSPASGIAGDFRLSVQAEANEAPDDRSASVTLRCGEVVKTVAVHQAQKNVITVSAQEVEVPEEGGSFSVKVSCNVPVSVKVDASWVSQSGTKSLETKEFIFTAQANAGEDDRTCVISFSGEDPSLSASVKVSQKAPAVFELSPSDVSVDYPGGTFTVTVRSSLSYSVASMPSWIKEVSSKAVYTTVHTFEAEANAEQEERSGVIVYCNASGVCVPVNVKQAAAPAPQPSGIDWNKAFTHKSLIMRFTATWCGYCPMMAETVALALQRRPGRYEAVNFHGSGSDLEFSSISPLMSAYSISGYPTAVVDGRRSVGNYNSSYGVTLVEQDQDETEANYPVVSAIGANSSWQGSELSVDVDVYCKEPDSYKVTVLLLEDGIVGYQADYINGDHSDYHHDHTARIALSNVVGDAFSTVEPNTAKRFSYKVNVPSQYVKANLSLLVYVQREFGSQKKLSDFRRNSFYVDNAASVKAGEELKPAQN